MVFHPAARHLSLFGFALAITVSFYVQNTSSQQRSQSELASRYLNQVSSQVETFVQRAREEKARDPLGQAIAYFSQGIEPRVLKIEKVPAAEAATPSISLRDGWYEVSQLLRPDDETAMKIQLRLGEVGFLGARSKLANDLNAVWVATLIFTLAFFLGRAKHPVARADRPDLKQKLSLWLGNFRAALLEMGLPIRDSLKNTQVILAGVKQCAWLGHKLRRGLHEQLSAMHRQRKDFVQTAEITAEIVTLASQLGPTDPRALKILRLAHNLRALEQKNQALLRNFEIQLEPWVTDADLLVGQLGELSGSTDELRKQVRDATSKLLAQAQVFRDVSAEATK